MRAQQRLEGIVAQQDELAALQRKQARLLVRTATRAIASSEQYWQWYATGRADVRTTELALLDQLHARETRSLWEMGGVAVITAVVVAAIAIGVHASYGATAP